MAFILRGPSSLIDITKITNLVAKTTQNFAESQVNTWPDTVIIDWKPQDFLNYEQVERKLLEENERNDSCETRRLIRAIARSESQLKQITSQGVMLGVTVELDYKNEGYTTRAIAQTHILDRGALYDFSSGQFLPSTNREILVRTAYPLGEYIYWNKWDDMAIRSGGSCGWSGFKKLYDEYLNIALQECQRRLSGAPAGAAVGIMNTFSR